MENINKELQKENNFVGPIEIPTDEGRTPEGEKPKRKRGRPAKVEKQIFIDVWNKASNLNEVAAMLGMPRTSVSVKASNLRKTGCNLKMFRRGRKAKVAR